MNDTIKAARERALRVHAWVFDNGAMGGILCGWALAEGDWGLLALGIVVSALDFWVGPERRVVDPT